MIQVLKWDPTRSTTGHDLCKLSIKLAQGCFEDHISSHRGSRISCDFIAVEGANRSQNCIYQILRT